jgi:major membrane immunogen (membrane-anchored lipoprotein)
MGEITPLLHFGHISSRKESKMRKAMGAAMILIQVFFISLSCKDSGKNTVLGPEVMGIYKNGTYEGHTPKDVEGYNALALIEVKKSFITAVGWKIYDNNLKRYFDSTYEEVYTGNALYIQQCRDNMKGMVAYGPQLIETQNVDSVDCITGATWCFYKFKQVVKIALKDAVEVPAGTN